MSIKSIFIILLSVFTLQCAAQSEIVMLGHVGQRNAEIWVHWPMENETISIKYSTIAPDIATSQGGKELLFVSNENNLSSKIVLSSLQPGTHYTYFLESQSFTRIVAMAKRRSRFLCSVRQLHLCERHRIR